MAFDVQQDPSKDDYISMSLHDMFRVIGDQITQRDLKVLKFISGAFISDEMLSNVHTGYDFFLCMEAMNRVTESNFRHVLDLLRIISRHDMSQFVNLRRRHPVIPDPVCEYLDTVSISTNISKTSSTKEPENNKESTCTSAAVPSTSSEECSRTQAPAITDASTSSSQPTSVNDSSAVGEKRTLAEVYSEPAENSSTSPQRKRQKMKHGTESSNSEGTVAGSSRENDVGSSLCGSVDKRHTDVAHDEKRLDQDAAQIGSHSYGQHVPRVWGNLKDDMEIDNTTTNELSSCDKHRNKDTVSSKIKSSCSMPSCETELSSTDKNTNCDVLCRTESDSGTDRAAITKGDNCDSSAASCSTSTSVKNDENSSLKSIDCDSKTELAHVDPSDLKMESSTQFTKDSKPELPASNGDTSDINTQPSMDESVTSSDKVECNPDSSARSKTELSAPDCPSDGAGGSDKDNTTNKSQESSTDDQSSDAIKKKYTCDIRLRVRAEYCQHNNALEGNVFSNKPTILERQFEKFTQANTILKSRDLGSIVCDIKFSELTYLDAFWRDYINGSLLEALKGVFLTDSLKQAVGHEAIKLLVNVDEDDYESGRLQLLKNLVD